MRVIFMGTKPFAVKALEYLLEKDIEVVAVVTGDARVSALWKDALIETAHKYNIPITKDNELYKALESKKQDAKAPYKLDGIDLVISFGFTRRIKRPLIRLPKLGCVNFHPAPLPDYRGMGGVYNFAIYRNLSEWGVSAHFVDEDFDTGDLIKVMKFNIDSSKETAFSLSQKSHDYLVILFKEVIDMVSKDSPLPRTPQGKGEYISKQDLDSLRKIQPEDSAEEINKKIRACWCPPHQGACIELKGQEFTLVNEEILREIAKIHSEDK